MSDTIVVKVGGSLYDLPDLGPRLQRFLHSLPAAPILLVPGGGATTDVIRALDQCHLLGEEKSHWLALRALTLNAHFLGQLLSGARLTHRVTGLSSGLWLLDAFAFLVADEGQPGCLPHTWQASSDAVAGRVALVSQANLLVLLKSTTIPGDTHWSEAAERGWVDSAFPEVLRQASWPLEVCAVNLRQ